MRMFVSTRLPLCAFKSEHEQLAPTPDTPARPTPPRKKIGPADFGSCTLKASGAFTADETIPGDKKSASSKFWQSEDERAATPMPALTINCTGKNLRLS